MVRDKVLEGVIKLNHVRSHCQLADMLTKALGYNQFSNLVDKMGMVNIHTPVALDGEYKNGSKDDYKEARVEHEEVELDLRKEESTA